ncbi:MAG: xanthine dehydrogenase family protein molybdopterin-binding subunit [Alphaproteobacteria bacterium]
MSPSKSGPYIGRPIPRIEDERLVAGAGRYTDDVALPGQLHAHFVRSPYPHAQIGEIDRRAAAEAAGVIAVLTAEDYTADGLRGIAHRPNPAGAVDHRERAFDPDNVVDLPHWPLAEERARHLGEPVAVIIASTKAQALDAAELLQIDYTPLDAIVAIDDAMATGAPILWEDALGNLCVDETFGDPDEVGRIFEGASHTVRLTFQSSRIVNCQMEPRSAIAASDTETGELNVIAGSQGVIRYRDGLREVLDLPEDRLHVVCPDVGGGFGPRSFLYPEVVVVAWAARRLGRPVRWTADRGEAFLADYQGRDMRFEAALALDESGRILALDIDMALNVGAHTVAFVPLANASRIVTTAYDIPAVALRARGVLTNTVPTSPYRGAGRPEATFAIERLIDLAAQRFGFDRIELRRRNLIPRDRLPYRNAMGLTYDSGDFLGNMERALALSDWSGAADRRRGTQSQGKLLGIGVANYVESPVGDPREQVTLSVRSDGTVDLVTGTQSTGQGHETTFAQVAADQLGVPLEAIRLRGGDTRLVTMGGGTHSDRSMRIAGTLILETAEKIIARARAACAQHWGMPPDAIQFDDGLLRDPGTNRTLSLLELAEALGPEQEDQLSASSSFVGRIPAHPTGCAVCEVEIDIETGALRITRYSTVDDVGRVVNPLIVDGQVHGGIVQGVGETLLEGVAHDETGQVLTGSFLDYALPRADDVPAFTIELREDPTPGNPLAIKGGGEAGITPASAAIVNAVVDALSKYGVEHIETPITSERIWRALNAKAG